MEDKLKSIWNSQKSEIIIDDDSATLLSRNRKPTIIDKITKTLKFEHYINLTSFPILFGISLYMGLYIEAIFCIVLFAPFIVYYHSLLKKMNQLSIEDDVKSYLEKNYHLLKKFIQHYKVAIVVYTLIGFFYGFFLGHRWTGTEQHAFKFSWSEFMIFLVTTVITWALAYAFLLLWIKLLYGKKIRHLRKLIQDFA